MSRDLSFWKTSTKVEVDNKTIYTTLSEAKHLVFIDEIPMDDIKEDFSKVFKDWINDDNMYYEKGSESFQLMITKQFVRAECYGVTKTSINMIVDILLKYNCPLYDPIIDVRFDAIK